MYDLILSFHGVIDQYDAYGPLVAAFLANMLATFGDKGQLVVVMLASKYDAKKVFVGAMAAFTLWSVVEVIFGALVLDVLPAGLVNAVAGIMFFGFGFWTLYGAYTELTTTDEDDHTITDFVPEHLQARMAAFGGVVTSFAFILVAEFGDKTQLLTINLAATFPDSPIAVLIGVLSALALRTGVDAVIGEKAEDYIPTGWIQLVAAVTFIFFGLLVVGLI